MPWELAAGAQVAGYRIVAEIGRGGMGVVYQAEQVVLERRVALKLIAPEHASAEGFRQRFLREAKLAASLEHPNVIPVHDAGEAEGVLYQPEVREVDTLPCRPSGTGFEEDVCRLHVPVDQSSGVCGVERISHLLQDVDDPLGFERAFTFDEADGLEDPADQDRDAGGDARLPRPGAGPGQAHRRPGGRLRARVPAVRSPHGTPAFRTRGRSAGHRGASVGAPSGRLLPPGGVGLGRRLGDRSSMAKAPDGRYASCREMLDDLEGALAGNAPSPVPEPRGRTLPAPPPAPPRPDTPTPAPPEGPVPLTPRLGPSQA